MNRPFCLLLTALAWIHAGVSPALAEAPPIRILPIGDSITLGIASGGYRGTLYQLLLEGGYNVDYVGTSVANSDPLAEKEHEGHSGWRTDEINFHVPTWLAAIPDPDVILLHIGTNDFGQGHFPALAIDRLDTLILTMAKLRPAANIIVTNLLEREKPFNPAIMAQFNPYVEARVAAHAAAGRKVTFLDMRAAVPLADMPDLLHPNQAGYNKMAAAWLAAIRAVITPEGDQSPPEISRVQGNLLRNKISITFTKPLAENSAPLTNFTVSGGLTLSNPVLDPSKRVVTLSTSRQTPGMSYTVKVSHVMDRIAPTPHEIVANSTGSFTGLLTSPVNLLRRYSFNTAGAVEDTAGGTATTANGTLVGAATVTGGSLVTHGEAEGTAYASIPGAATAGITGSFSIQQFATPASAAGFYQTLSSFTKPGTDNNGGTQSNFVISNPVRNESNFPSGYGYRQPGLYGGNQKLVLGPRGDTDGIQHVFTTTFDSTIGVARYYMDGSLRSSSEPGALLGFNLSALTNIGINGRAPFNHASLTGSTNEFRIYQGALTVEQVKATSADADLTAATFADLGIAFPGLDSIEPPNVQNYSLNVAARTLDMTFSSSGVRNYQMMQSTDLIFWSSVGPEIQGQVTRTKVQINFPSAPARFFRVQPKP